MDKRDKFRGCLVGGAVGDAPGYAVEFCSEREIFAKYGAGGIAEFDLIGGKAVVSGLLVVLLVRKKRKSRASFCKRHNARAAGKL